MSPEHVRGGLAGAAELRQATGPLLCESLSLASHESFEQRSAVRETMNLSEAGFVDAACHGALRALALACVPRAARIQSAAPSCFNIETGARARLPQILSKTSHALQGTRRPSSRGPLGSEDTWPWHSRFHDKGFGTIRCRPCAAIMASETPLGKQWPREKTSEMPWNMHLYSPAAFVGRPCCCHRDVGCSAERPDPSLIVVFQVVCVASRVALRSYQIAHSDPATACNT